MARGVSEKTPSSRRVRVATYNIHKGRGLDGRERLDRIVDVLREVGADLVALQEVLLPQARVLTEATGMQAVFGPIRRHGGTPYGNLSLSRFPLVAHARYNLTCRPFEPRGCLRVDVDLDPGGRAPAGRPLHVFNVHLGLHYRERVRQAEALAAILDGIGETSPRLLLGDFNEWFPGRASRLLRQALGPPNGGRRPVRTHPSPLPVFPLDRIYLDGAGRLVRVRVHRSRLARLASDHLPTYADIALPGPAARSDGARS
jgi:endonuclease/exonuclease/phosphatase family metal-dependent hydrolase